MKTFKQLMLEIRGFSPGMMRFIGKPDSGIEEKPAKQDVIRRAARIGLKKGVSPLERDTGAEGSSRLYVKLREPENITLDGKPASIRTGVKVALRPRKTLKWRFEAGRRKGRLSNTSVGAMQNEAENGDRYVNRQYRVITKNEDGSHSTNTERGIFPPLLDHDKKNHEWAHVGHTDDLTHKDFPELTKTKSHPEGISHSDFMAVLHRDYDRLSGAHIPQSEYRESRMDEVEEHPLVQKFLDHQRDTYTPPNDYYNIENLGVWTHPHTGEKHVVARDHGFSEPVRDFYNLRGTGYSSGTSGSNHPRDPLKTTRISS